MIVTEKTWYIVRNTRGVTGFVGSGTDRLVSILGVEFAYNNTADLIHQGIAHYYPNLADMLGEKCLERYNIPVYYSATPAGGQKYQSVREIIADLEDKNIEFQTMMMGCCKIAFDNNDIHVYAELLDLLKDVNKIVEQVILLKDKIDIYKDNPSYDSHVYKFWILGENNNG